MAADLRIIVRQAIDFDKIPLVLIFILLRRNIVPPVQYTSVNSWWIRDHNF
jgi:hypothetical protein